jgi:hypothetical protein
MDKIHKFSPIIKQKFGLVFGGHYRINNSDPDFLKKLESAIERQKANQPQPNPNFPSNGSLSQIRR